MLSEEEEEFRANLREQLSHPRVGYTVSVAIVGHVDMSEETFNMIYGRELSKSICRIKAEGKEPEFNVGGSGGFDAHARRWLARNGYAGNTTVFCDETDASDVIVLDGVEYTFKVNGGIKGRMKRDMMMVFYAQELVAFTFEFFYSAYYKRICNRIETKVVRTDFKDVPRKSPDGEALSERGRDIEHNCKLLSKLRRKTFPEYLRFLRIRRAERPFGWARKELDAQSDQTVRSELIFHVPDPKIV